VWPRIWNPAHTQAFCGNLFGEFFSKKQGFVERVFTEEAWSVRLLIEVCAETTWKNFQMEELMSLNIKYHLLYT